jgi:allantoicase
MNEPSQAAVFAGLTDLAARVLGGRVLIASDDFFAEKENLLEPGRGVFIADKYTDRGKWMDGWESRRKRVPGHDWCIVKLGVRGMVHGIDIDTNHFLGNHPPLASLDGCVAAEDAAGEALRDEAEWIEIVPPSPLKPGSQNAFAVSHRGPFTHVRLHIYPDGGVARLKVWGEPLPRATVGDALDLAAVQNGGRAVACSDMFFSPMVNLILPGKPADMGGGWETRRRRAPGNEWIIVQLCASGELDALEVDTDFFKGNYPDRCTIEGLCWPYAPVTALLPRVDHDVDRGWVPVLRESKLTADGHHRFTELLSRGPFTHLRLSIYPCGGVSRMRAFGRIVELTAEPGLARLNELGSQEAVAALLRACGSTRWAKAMTERRPFVSRTELFGVADQCWWRLGERDWREAFSHHPEIGADIAKLRERFAATASWSAGEQAGALGASEATLQALARKNREYRERFGHVFLVCATGKSADEMLALLEQRSHNSRENELAIAAGEQAKITRLRLDKLLEELAKSPV